MKWLSLFLLFLIPSLLYGFDEDKCQKIYANALSEWKWHEAYLNDIQNLEPNEKEIRIRILNDAIACCHRAIGYCDKILEKIAKQSKKTQRKKWCIKIKKEIKRDKNSMITEISHLQNAIAHTHQEIAFEKALPFYQESEQKTELANTKNQNCNRDLNAVEAVVATLNEIGELYRQASSAAKEALDLISPYPDEVSKNTLQQAIASYSQAAAKCEEEALNRPQIVKEQIAALKAKLQLLEEEQKVYEEKGLKRSVFEVLQRMFPLVETLVSIGEEKQERLEGLKNAIAHVKEQQDQNRPTVIENTHSKEVFKTQEEERRGLFFKQLLPESLLAGYSGEQKFIAIPLDGQKSTNTGEYTLYTEQFYRFLISANLPRLHVQVYEQGQCIDEEYIDLPQQHTTAWDRYLTDDGFLFFPESRLKAQFGLDLRANIICDFNGSPLLLLALRTLYPQYTFIVSSEEQGVLFVSRGIPPPPWQLASLCKPGPLGPRKPLELVAIAPPSLNLQGGKTPYETFPLIDQFVEELKKDPLAIAAYITNEIALVDPFLSKSLGAFVPPPIHRSCLATFLEKQGSAWEQCQLLIYALGRAGYRAVYTGGLCQLPKTFVENLLFTQIPDEQQEVLLNYPGVLFFDGKEWISLFPWMKEMQVVEGYDLYPLLPEKYASADRWIFHYLKGDEQLLKQIGSEEDDSLGTLFVRFAEEELRKQGLTLNDVGIWRTQVKKQYTSWEEFAHPLRVEQWQCAEELQKGYFAKTHIEISSREHPEKKYACDASLAQLADVGGFITFSSLGMHIQMLEEEHCISLDDTDNLIDVTLTYLDQSQTFTFAKGTTAALCFHFGGVNTTTASQFYQQFSLANQENERLRSLLSFLGASYFQRCSRSEKILAGLHKLNPMTVCAFGLAKLVPGTEGGSLPQVDMFWFRSTLPKTDQGKLSNYRQCASLLAVDTSSNEHQVLRDLFNDPNAISTIKLLQLSHLRQLKNNDIGTGFLALTPSLVEMAKNTPELTQALFPIHNLNLRELQIKASAQWRAIEKWMDPTNPLSAWAYAYMTPGPISSRGETYQEIATLLVHPRGSLAMISFNNLLIHGGLGSAIPSKDPIAQWKLIPHQQTYALQTVVSSVPEIASLPQKQIPDVRLEHKSLWNGVSDPVDVVSGAFYIDEIDLVLPGPFPLQIRRNYNSQNPLLQELGYGWKLSVNPYMIEQEGKRYIAEADGTVIVYCFSQEAQRWEIAPNDNPDLYNCNGNPNPFHAYIEDEILYGADGSKRLFENGRVKTWSNASGNTLSFSYSDDKLKRIESSNGHYCIFRYTPEGRIEEIYAKDGRRIRYTYYANGDLATVELPNSACIVYEYDSFHRIQRETKPEGCVLENIYDDQGRVFKQLSPVDPRQELTVTATFTYAEGETTVTDGRGGKTTYNIFEKQIYKITDPLGYHIYQSWFIDDTSWFDAEQGKVVPWDKPGAFLRSIKTTTDKRGLTTSHLYDEKGNLLEIRLEGNDLTGKGDNCVVKRFAYNQHNLPIAEESCGRKVTTTYDPIFSYLPKRIETYSNATLISYVDLEYNARGLVERQDYSGAVTFLQYDSYGFPSQKKELTGTDDPDVITQFMFTSQGQCNKRITSDAIEKTRYNIMGYPLCSQVFSTEGKLLSATFTDYNLNNAPIWEQNTNSRNALNIDYNASGQIKALRHQLGRATAYRIYEHDELGNCIEDVDPLGHCTIREFDIMGRVKKETLEGLSSAFTYEAGGLVETMTTPSGAVTTRLYTTNGLLAKEIYPDGTTTEIIYDKMGRPIQETKQSVIWDITYDDLQHRIIRTHRETQNTEIQEFDPRGNCIQFTDAAGYTEQKTYDGLNRLKTQTTPSGEITTWNYSGDLVVCTLPSGEKTITRTENAKLAESSTFDLQGNLIAHTLVQYDPENDLEVVTQGEEQTFVWFNGLGLPIREQKGEVVTLKEYNLRGDCIAITDGEGRTTRQTFDALKRLRQKELPDGAVVQYDYDEDSNLTRYDLPNGAAWVASYDEMSRLATTDLQAQGVTSQPWEHTYEAGLLKETKDPLGRVHSYFYDSYQRLTEENVEGGQRKYTYDPRGFATLLEQISKEEYSSIKRDYDSDRRLILESITLNGELLQHTDQSWNPSSRTLEIGDHKRSFFYQHGSLARVAATHVDLSYSYSFSRALKTRTTPLSASVITHAPSALPELIETHIPQGAIQECLSWDGSGKLSSYLAPRQQKGFTYTDQGYITSAGTEKYTFDFGAPGTGVRTTAPSSYVPPDGLDPFGNVEQEVESN